MTDIASDSDARLLEQTLFEVKKVIVGQDRLIERLMTALLAGGHCLLEGVPGVAKTLAAETLAVAVGGSFRRLQFTPDLVPSDIVGTRIYRASKETFDVELGPVMANLVLPPPGRGMRRPDLFRSIRFRLTVVYSTLLFALAGAGLAVTYFAVAATTNPQPVNEQTAYRKYGRTIVDQVTVAEVSEIEAAINYNTLEDLRRYSLFALGGLFIASLGIGWVLSGRVLRPVGAIARTAREIQATDLSRRIQLSGPHDELRDLADTIDSMLDRLDEAFQAQRQLIDDASHELRSPLAIIRTNLDASLTTQEATPAERERAVAVVDRATTRMSRLVEDLLATARRDAHGLSDADVELTAIAREAGEESFITTRGLRLHYDLSEELHLIGDADGLRRAVGNLLSNAVRLAPDASTVTVATGRKESWLWLAVADQGPGIAEADLPRVFDRFWRGDQPMRSQQRRTGLGLAIVRQIVESHGGQVAVFSKLGEGSTFVLWLPALDRTDASAPPTVSPWL